ncbi:MAG: flagellar hook-associated protein FlgK [Hyphomicrobiales bacterium]
MSLSLASNIAQSTLAATAAQVAIVSRNIDGANNPNYSRKIADLTTSMTGSGGVVSVSRAADKALYEKMLVAQSTAASQKALSNGLDQLDQTIGDPSNGQSPSALLGSFANALQTYSASPNDTTVAQSVITAASNLTSALNGATAIVQGVRTQADADMATSVQTINSLLSQFQAVNADIMRGTQSGADVTDNLDQRDAILSRLSQEIGITTTTSANGGMAVYTDGGVTLFQGSARSVTFQTAGTFTAATTGNAVFVDGVPITGSSSPMPIQSGKLAGLSNLRDHVAVTYQSQLDETARGLIDAFKESDQSATPTLPDAPGLFTYSGAPAMPGTGLVAGLAGDIKVNANVDPGQGGNVNLLRDGGIANSGAVTAYTYNTAGGGSFTARIQQLIDGIAAPQSFDPAAGLNASASLTDFSTASVSWLESNRQSASNASTYQTTLVSNASTALSNSTGVNLDSEMSKMLDLEHSYQASSKLLSTIDSLYTALFQAV